jgi:hypothetical protein
VLGEAGGSSAGLLLPYLCADRQAAWRVPAAPPSSSSSSVGGLEDMPHEEGAPATSPSCISVGFAFMPKKMESMQRIVQQTNSRAAGGARIDYRRLDFGRDLADQGPFDVILHKLSEDVSNRVGDQEADLKLSRLEKYLRENPQCMLLDPLASVALATNRVSTLKVLDQVQSDYSLNVKDLPRIPPYVVIPSGTSTEALIDMVSSRLHYPLICKPVLACGTSGSHSMTVVLDGSSISQISSKLPIIVQEYRNHSARLWKVNVIGDVVRVHERPSLPDLPPNLKGVVMFDSQKAYPGPSDFGLSNDQTYSSSCNCAHPGGLDTTVARGIARCLQNAFGLSIFGFDIIMDCETSDLLCIDVNYFPSFRDLKVRHHFVPGHHANPSLVNQSLPTLCFPRISRRFSESIFQLHREP